MYDLHITKRNDWIDDGSDITEQEWLGVLKAFDTLKPKDKIDVITKAGENFSYTLENTKVAKWNDYWFTYNKGRIDITNPDEKAIEQAKQIANHLQAYLQGDDGEIYADYTDIVTPIRSDYRKLRHANLPEGYPVDDLNPEAMTVTKMEVLDLKNKQYQNLDTIEAFIKRHINKLNILFGVVVNGEKYTRGKDFNYLHLEIAIPEKTATLAQKNKLNELQEYANEKGTRLIIAEVA